MKLLKKHVKWFYDYITFARVDSLAAHGAFFIMISFIPFIAFLLAIMQRIHFSSGMTLFSRALEIFPDSVALYIEQLLSENLSSSGLIPVTIIACLWSSSMGMVAIIKGLDIIYGVKETRNYIHLRAIAVLSVIVFAFVIMITAVLLVFGSSVYRWLTDHSSPVVASLLMQFKSLASFVILIFFFLLLYNVVPKKRVRFIHNLAGAVFSSAGWVLFSYFFAIFVENFSNFSLIYGSLAALVVLMFWLFFCMYIMFLGAVFAMWLETSGICTDVSELVNSRRRKKGKKELHFKRNSVRSEPVFTQTAAVAEPPRNKSRKNPRRNPKKYLSK